VTNWRFLESLSLIALSWSLHFSNVISLITTFTALLVVCIAAAFSQDISNFKEENSKNEKESFAYEKKRKKLFVS
jgi:DNA integrity scanning protein DisA with diadenylate cyclase activity